MEMCSSGHDSVVFAVMVEVNKELGLDMNPNNPNIHKNSVTPVDEATGEPLSQEIMNQRRQTITKCM